MITEKEILSTIKSICISHGATEIYLFGSRAKRLHNTNSDYDIALRGVKDILSLEDDLDDIPMLIKIDVVDLDTCKNVRLLEDIENDGIQI